MCARGGVVQNFEFFKFPNFPIFQFSNFPIFEFSKFPVDPILLAATMLLPPSAFTSEPVAMYAVFHIQDLSRTNVSPVPFRSSMVASAYAARLNKEAGYPHYHIITLDTKSPIIDNQFTRLFPWEAARVKWFNPKDGFGFVTLDATGQDVLIHVNTLRACHVPIPDSLDPVEIFYGRRPRGLTAILLRYPDANAEDRH